MVKFGLKTRTITRYVFKVLCFRDGIFPKVMHRQWLSTVRIGCTNIAGAVYPVFEKTENEKKNQVASV